MRHLLLILALFVITYVLWKAAPTKKRRHIKTMVRRHALPILGCVLTLFGLFFAAVRHPSIQLF